MTDKVVRDEILRSHRYVSLSNDTAKLLFLHLFLASDSLSNAEATSTAISIIMGRAFSEQAAVSLLTEMSDRDLVRIYQVEGKRYVHIPRSRQRLRYLSGKHPRPPASIEDREITDLIAKVGLKSDRGQTQVGPFPQVVGVDVVVAVDKLKFKSKSPNAQAATAAVANEKSQSLVAVPQAATAAVENGKGTRLTEDWKLPEAWKNWATSAHPELDAQRVVRISLSFRDYWISKVGKDGRRANWQATWRNWIRREVERA